MRAGRRARRRSPRAPPRTARRSDPAARRPVRAGRRPWRRPAPRPIAASTMRAVMRRRSPARWKLPTTARSRCSSARRADRSAPTRADGFDDAHAIDDAKRPAARRSFVTVSAMPEESQANSRSRADVREVEHGDGRRRRGGAARGAPARRRGLRGATPWCDGRDEAVAAPRDGLDVGGLGRVVAERLAQLRDRLRERVVGDGDVRPERA